MEQCLANGGTDVICTPEAEEAAQQAFKECDCKENAENDRVAGMQWCDMLDGDEKDQCVRNTEEAYAEAIEACIPKTCAEQYDEAFTLAYDYCLDEGRNQLVCEVQAK